MKESTNRYCRPNFKDFIKKNEVVRLATDVYETVPKILFRQTADKIIATVDYKGIWFGRSIITMTLNPTDPHRIEYFLGLMNSKYMEYVYRQLVNEEGRVYPQVKLTKVKRLPLRIIDFSKVEEKAIHDQIVSLVTLLINLYSRIDFTPNQKELTKRTIQVTEDRINEIVNHLYEVTDDELVLIKQSTVTF